MPIGVDVPRLNRGKSWGYWFVTVDGKTLVFNRRESGNYQISLADLHTPEDARIRVHEVLARKDAWVDQRVIDDLRRAIRDLTKLVVPEILVDQRFR